MYYSTKVISLGSCAFRQPFAKSHCRFIHGYRLQAKFYITAKELDSNNWVYDFGEFKKIKATLEESFDHTTAIADNDPDLPTFKKLHKQGIIDLRIMKGGVGIEKFAKHCHDIISSHLFKTDGDRVWCDKVEVWEHPENSAIYTD